MLFGKPQLEALDYTETNRYICNANKTFSRKKCKKEGNWKSDCTYSLNYPQMNTF